MFATTRTLATTMLARQAEFLGNLTQKTFRQLLLEGHRRRNVIFDAVFYDVGVVTADEANRLAEGIAHEGTVLVVPPSGRGPLEIFANHQEFLAAPQHTGVDVLAITGVGSSALGSAAYARDVADGLGRPVAAVVSGYGLSDFPTEALGGFFLFATLNRLRHAFEHLDVGAIPAPAGATIAVAGGFTRSSLDTQSVYALLCDPHRSFRVITGHSKGNLVISEALYELADRNPARLTEIGRTATVVTVGACIPMPDACRTVIDVIGSLDWFGGLNSDWTIPVDVPVCGAWHHTNPCLPAALEVRPLFERLRAQGLP